MKYRLGLDLGTSSLGWCCLDIENEDDRKILDMGVRIFPDGRNDKTKDPLCVARREARSSRTRLRRFKQRKTQLIADLQSIGLLPEDKLAFKELEKLNPYELRVKAITTKLEPFELGRALFHLNQRRGFLNSRKEEKDALKEENSSSNSKSKARKETKTQKAMNQLLEDIKAANCQTLGEYMYRSGKMRFSNPTDATGKFTAATYPNREMYQDEFEKIWNFQKQYYPDILTDENKQLIAQYDIFYQRPLKKQETGYCSLEKEEKRAPSAYVVAQNFRIISEVYNLKITYPEHRVLNKEERERLLDYLNNPQEKYKDDIVPFEKILDILDFSPKETTLNLMVNNRVGLKYNVTNALLGDEKNFGAEWFEFTPEKQNKIVDILQDYSLTQEKIAETLKKECPELSVEQINNIINDSLFLPDGYANLSEKAMRKLCQEMLASGVNYETAVENVYQKNINELRAFPQRDYLPPYQELLSESLIGGNKELDKELFYDDYMGRISNVSVHIALNQLRYVVNDLIKKYSEKYGKECGKPEEITIELGRELTYGKKALDDITKRQKENAKIMSEARKALREIGIRPTSFNLEKYKVWRNLNPKKDTERVDLYTGKNISLTELFSDGYDIEHILPYSWTYDDSYDNKIITRADVNRKKLNQLPYDFFSDEAQLRSLAKTEEEFAEMQLEKVRERAKDIDKARGNAKRTFNFKSIYWRFSKNAREIFNRNNKNLARDLNDMRYMSKLAKRYLTCICPDNKIISAKGSLTDLMKQVWNIADTLPKDYKLWQVQKWQKYELLEKYIKRLADEHLDWDDEQISQKAKELVENMSEAEIQAETSIKKDRSIHYHHALDAFTLANINHSIIHYVSSSEFANKAEELVLKKNEQADVNKKINIHEAQLKILKQSGKFYECPYPSFDKEKFSQQLENIVVSYKKSVDKLEAVLRKAQVLQKNKENFSFASIHRARAFGFRKILAIKNGDIELELAQRKNGKIEKEKESLSCMVPIFRTREQKQTFLAKYAEWQKACVRKKFLPKAEYEKIEKEFIETFSKDKAFKWYKADGNYAAQIYQINKNDKFSPNKKEEWSVEILSNYYAFERNGRFFWQDTHPTAKLITTLKINDVVEATFRRDDDMEKGFSKIKAWVKHQFDLNPESQQLPLLFRVKKMSGGNIFLRPLHIAQEDNGDVKSWACSVGKFKEYHCRKVGVTAIGKVVKGC